jgi:beta-N-acetylhexosaminidase
MVAARRAVTAEGPVRIGDTAEVVSFGSPPSQAAGEVPWGMESALAQRDVRVGAGGGSLVLVVRDLHRNPDRLAEVEEALARRPDAVLVEMGVPVCRPQGARAYIATHGSSRVCAVAAAELMRP